ncbi:MAG: ABC transporter permease [Caldilineaceae bacterium]|nr:ABC transporter permease [Caldilineaceae bacterium]
MSRDKKVTQSWVHQGIYLSCLLYVILLILCAIFAEHIAPYSFLEQDLQNIWEPPSVNHLLGTDGLGRDILSRLIYGTRVSLMVATLASLFVAVIGIPLGLISGYFGGFWDSVIMRIVDVLYAFPDVLLIIVVSAIIKANIAQGDSRGVFFLQELDSVLGGILGILLALGLTTWPVVSRLIRSQTLSIREFDFVIASYSIGSRELWILRKHIFPNIIGSALTAMSLIVPYAIIVEAGLSFLGLGVDPPMPSWGRMISEGSLAMRAHPHLLISSTVLLAVTVLVFMLIGDWVRERFDPNNSIIR